MILPGIFASQISGHLYSGPAGAFDALGSVTVGSGGLASITFSAIPQTYTHLQIRWISRDNRGVSFNSPQVQFNGDASTSYIGHYLEGTGSSAIAGVYSAATSFPMGFNTGSSAAANAFAAGITDILDYTSTTKNKTVRILSGADLNGSGYIDLDSALWFNTPQAITSINITAAGGNTFQQYSSFALYGIK